MSYGTGYTSSIPDGTASGDFVPSGGTARTYHVAKAGTPYTDIGSAIAQAVTDGIGADRVDIVVHPGLYTETSTIDVPGNVCVRGVSKGVARLINSTTDYFRCTGANTFFEDLLFEGNGAAATWCINANNQNAVHVRRVDLLNNGGTSTQGFITQAGATWAVLFIEDCIVDSYKTTGDVVFLDNTSGTARFVDAIINNVFFDNFFGGDLIRIEGCQDVRIRNSTLRTDVGIMVDLQTGGATGTPFAKISNSWLGTSPGSTLGVPVEIGSSCSMEIFDTYWDPTASTLTGNLIDNSWKTGGIGTWYYSADTTPDTAGEMYANTTSTTTTTQLILFHDDFYGNRQREMLENTPAGSYLMVKGLDANTGSSAIWKISSTEQVSTDRVQIDFTGTATHFVGTTNWADISHWQLYIIPGADLGMPLQYEFDSSTSATDPGSGAFRLDTSDAGTASNLYISNLNANGHGLFAILHDADIIGEGSQIVIVNQVDQTQSARFWVNGPTVDNTGWVTIPVDNTKDSQSTNWVFPSDAVPFAIYIYPANGHRFTERADHFYTPEAGFGEVWSKNTAPNSLWFTNDLGEDVILTSGAKTAPSYTFSTTTAAADPGAGTFRLNTSDYNTASAIYINDADRHGLGIGSILSNAIAADTNLIIADERQPSKRWRFLVTSVVDNTGWFTINLDNTNDSKSTGAGTIPDNGAPYGIGILAKPGAGGGVTSYSFRVSGVMPNTPVADTWYGPDDRSGITGDQLWSDTYGTATAPALANYTRNPAFIVPAAGTIERIVMQVRTGGSANNGSYSVWKSTPTDDSTSVGTFTQLGTTFTITSSGANRVYIENQSSVGAAVSANDRIYVLYRAAAASPDGVGMYFTSTIVYEET